MKYLLLKLLIPFFLSLLVAVNCFSQIRWSVNPYDERVFIENKGQWAAVETELHCKILFAFEQGNTMFYLGRDQFIVRESEREIIPGEKENETDPARSKYPANRFGYIRFGFGSEGRMADITGEKKCAALNKYLLPGKGRTERPVTAASFLEVKYKNIYPGIDLIFSAHPKNGLQYEYIVHPYADASLIRHSFSEKVNAELDKEGNLRASADDAKVIDYAPRVFYETDKTAIAAHYVLSANSYKINTANYDHGKCIVIDPWVVNPNFTDQNIAFDIAADSAGDVYVFGGHSPWKLKKFDPSGNPVWTFNTTYNSWYGALAVDYQGNSYITEGCCGGNIQKLDTGGNAGWHGTYGTNEFWRLAFNCDYSRLYLATGYATGPTLFTSISLLDTSTGAISNSTSVFAGTQDEPRMLSCGLNGNLYAISCTGQVPADQVIEMTTGFSVLFSDSSNYTLAYNGPTYANGSNTTSGQNGLSGGLHFFCSSDGATLYKRNNNTGNVTSSIPIPAGHIEGNSGLYVDLCDHIYVGTSNAVLRYDSSFNLISTDTTTGAVYCLGPGKNGDLLACGNGFIASIGLSVCTGPPCTNIVPTDSLQANATGSNAGCNGCSGSATAIATHGTTPYHYHWNPGNDTSAVINNLCAGTYIVTISDASGGSVIDTVVISQPTPPQVHISADTTLICPSDSAYICATPGFAAYHWSRGDTTTCIHTSAAGNYYLTVTDRNNCTAESNHLAITVLQVPPVSISVNGDTLRVYNAVSEQWIRNGVFIPNAVSNTYIAKTPGSYTVQVKDSNGCSTSSNPVVIAGITEPAEERVEIYPNPLSAGSWQLDVGNGLIGAEAEIFDDNGRLVYKSQIRNLHSEIEPDISSGVYLMYIHSSDSNIVRKLVKL